MKNNQPGTHTGSTHQTVTEEIKLQIGKKSIRIGFTEQRVSPLAGMLSWAGYLLKKQVPELLRRMLPHQPTSPNALPPVDIALGFLACRWSRFYRKCCRWSKSPRNRPSRGFSTVSVRRPTKAVLGSFTVGLWSS